MSQLAKDKKRWNKKVYSWLKSIGIVTCEWYRPCSDMIGLAFAHSRKQRRILDEVKYSEGALLCARHHHYAEYGDSKHKGTHRRMKRLIDGIRRKRYVPEGAEYHFDDGRAAGEAQRGASRTARRSKRRSSGWNTRNNSAVLHKAGWGRGRALRVERDPGADGDGSVPEPSARPQRGGGRGNPLPKHAKLTKEPAKRTLKGGKKGADSSADWSVSGRSSSPRSGWRRPTRLEEVPGTDMKEDIEGYRRSAVKTKDAERVKEKVEEFESRGEVTKVIKKGGYHYIYIKKEKDLSVLKEVLK